MKLSSKEQSDLLRLYDIALIVSGALLRHFDEAMQKRSACVSFEEWSVKHGQEHADLIAAREAAKAVLKPTLVLLARAGFDTSELPALLGHTP